MSRMWAKVITVFLISGALCWNNIGGYANASDGNEPASDSQGSIQTTDLLVNQATYTPQETIPTQENQSSNQGNNQSDHDVLSLAIITKNNTFKVVGESNAASVAINIKDSSFVVVKQVSINVINGRFEWVDSLSNYTPEETYKVVITDDKGNTVSDTVTIPVKEDNYILNLAVLTSDNTLTVAGESSCTRIRISIKNSRFVEVKNITTDVKNGRFEWGDSIANYTPDTNYYISVTDDKGHTASDTVAIPAKEDVYTLTVSVSTKDGVLKIIGESSANSVNINIKDSNFKDVHKGSTSVNNGIYVWSESLSNYKEDETYKVIVTDKDKHTATEQVTIPISVKGIEFGDFEKKLEVGKSLTITTTVLPSGAQNQTVKYSSSNDNIATVSSSGKVTGHSAGQVIITASCGNVSAEVKLTVYIKTLKIEVNKNYLTMRLNETFQINAEAIPKTAEQKCTFTSTNERVATVTASGKITAKGSGVTSVIVSNGDTETIVTVVVNDGSNGKTGSSLGSYNKFNTKTQHIENSQLSSMIHNNATKEVVLINTDLSLVDSSALCMLKNENKNLIIDQGKYLILIKGIAIANPANTLSIDIPIKYVEDNIKFVVNDGQPLPGKITIQLRDKKVFTMKYLYLYNQIKNKYEAINSFNVDDKSIYIDKGGTYLLTEKKVSRSPINWIVSVVSGCVCVALGTGYVFTKRRYWFY